MWWNINIDSFWIYKLGGHSTCHGGASSCLQRTPAMSKGEPLNKQGSKMWETISLGKCFWRMYFPLDMYFWRMYFWAFLSHYQCSAIGGGSGSSGLGDRELTWKASLAIFWSNFLFTWLGHFYLQKMAKCGVKCILDLGEYFSCRSIIHWAVWIVHKHKIPDGQWGWFQHLKSS